MCENPKANSKSDPVRRQNDPFFGVAVVIGDCKRCLLGFWDDEEGATTVEMVVLMGASMGLGIATMDSVSSGIENLSNEISSFLSNIEIVTSFDPPEQVDL